MRAAFFLCLVLVSSAVAEDFKVTLQNPGMESGRDVPEGWRGKFGKVAVIRDTQTFHSGTASLSVQNTGGGSGSGHQMVAVKPGAKVKLGGWVKSSEGSKVNFAAQFFDEKFTWNEFLQVKYLEGAQDWQEAEKEFTVPAQATRMAIALYVEGLGRAWLDDVTLTVEGGTVVVPDSLARSQASEGTGGREAHSNHAAAGLLFGVPKRVGDLPRG